MTFYSMADKRKMITLHTCLRADPTSNFLRSTFPMEGSSNFWTTIVEEEFSPSRSFRGADGRSQRSESTYFRYSSPSGINGGIILDRRNSSPSSLTWSWSELLMMITSLCVVMREWTAKCFRVCWLDQSSCVRIDN